MALFATPLQEDTHYDLTKTPGMPVCGLTSSEKDFFGVSAAPSPAF